MSLPKLTTTSSGLVALDAAAAAPAAAAAGAGSGLRGSRPSLLRRDANFSPLRSLLLAPLLLAPAKAGEAVVSTVEGPAAAAAAKLAKGLAPGAAPAKGLAPGAAPPKGLPGPPNGGILCTCVQVLSGP